jgi:CRP-like cAMP-binding protein
MAELVFRAGEIIFKKGDPSDYGYFIRSGKVEIVRDFPDHPVRIAILNEGDILGEMGLIDERPRSLTARAVVDSVLSSVTRDEFVEMMQKQPAEALKYLRMFFERLRMMNLRAREMPKSIAAASKEAEFEVTLYPASPTAEHSVPQQGLLLKSPVFRVGRRSSRHEDPFEVNDLILLDNPPYNVSRNHFSIEKTEDAVYLHDRGSFLGTIVNGELVGGHHHGAFIQLKEGENDVVAGAHHSPFRFKVFVKFN